MLLPVINANLTKALRQDHSLMLPTRCWEICVYQHMFLQFLLPKPVTFNVSMHKHDRKALLCKIGLLILKLFLLYKIFVKKSGLNEGTLQEPSTFSKYEIFISPYLYIWQCSDWRGLRKDWQEWPAGYLTPKICC